jgi:subtilisin family serine protease
MKITHRSFHLKRQKLARTSHGTAVTAIIASRSGWHGLLPGAEIFHADVFHRNKKGKAVGSSKSIVRAIDWMIHQKVPVVNFCIGGGRNKLIEKYVEHASAAGMILIASSGNRGPFSKKKSYPGAYGPVIAVTAVDRRGPPWTAWSAARVMRRLVITLILLPLLLVFGRRCWAAARPCQVHPSRPPW